MKTKYNGLDIEGTPQEISDFLHIQDNEHKIHQEELKQDNTLQLEKAIQLIREPRATIATPFNVQITEPKKQRNKWKGKKWSKYVPEFLDEHPLYKQLNNRNKRLAINNFLKPKLKVTKVNPTFIRKFQNAIWWNTYVSRHKQKSVLIKKLVTPIKRSNSINWNKIALTWASLTPKPKEGIFLRKALGYIPNTGQRKRFQQELDSLMLTKKIPIKQNTPLNYSVIGLKPKLLKLRNKSFQNAKPKQHRIKRNWIQLATKYLDQKFINPQLTVTEFCGKEFGSRGGVRYMKLKKT